MEKLPLDVCHYMVGNFFHNTEFKALAALRQTSKRWKDLVDQHFNVRLFSLVSWAAALQNTIEHTRGSWDRTVVVIECINFMLNHLPTFTQAWFSGEDNEVPKLITTLVKQLGIVLTQADGYPANHPVHAYIPVLEAQQRRFEELLLQ
jgi:F-box associated protein